VLCVSTGHAEILGREAGGNSGTTRLPTGDKKKKGKQKVSWLGWEGSNLRMAESKSAALPLGYIPIVPMGPGTAPNAG
jgi:hypothetical protein